MAYSAPPERRPQPHGRSRASSMTRLGIIFTAERPPEELAAFAVAAEAAGLDELWLWEDCFLAGGIASSATALAATERITVGIGVMPAGPRQPGARAVGGAAPAPAPPRPLLAGPRARG